MVTITETAANGDSAKEALDVKGASDTKDQSPERLVYTPLWKYQIKLMGPSTLTYFRLSTVSPFMQRHLSKVYYSLALGFGLNALAAYMQLRFPVHEAAAWFGVWAPFLMILYLKPTPDNEDFRATLFFLTAFSKGLLVQNFYNPYLGIDVSILETCILGTTAILLSFSMAAFCASNRTIMYLLAVFFGVILTPLAVALAAIEFGKPNYLKEIYSGLTLVFWLVGLETQYIIERSKTAGCDPIWDALWVVLGIYGLPIRLLQVAANTLYPPTEKHKGKGGDAKGKGKGKAKRN